MMERIAALHGRLQVTLLVLLAALAVWGLACAALGRVGRWYVAGLWVTELLVVAQGLLGALLLFGGVPLGLLGLHLVYGAVAVLVIPVALAYSGERSSRWDALILVAGCVFLLGVVERAIATAPG
jgi:hypothetical protein